MEEWIRWAVGLAFAALTAGIGYIMAAHVRLSTKQFTDHTALTTKHSSDVAALHAKIDDVKEKYVRRDDFQNFRTETREQLQRIEDKTDSIITTLKH